MPHETGTIHPPLDRTREYAPGQRLPSPQKAYVSPARCVRPRTRRSGIHFQWIAAQQSFRNLSNNAPCPHPAAKPETHGRNGAGISCGDGPSGRERGRMRTHGHGAAKKQPHRRTWRRDFRRVGPVRKPWCAATRKDAARERGTPAGGQAGSRKKSPPCTHGGRIVI